MKEIILTQVFVIKVDDEDYENIIQTKWYPCRQGRYYYATDINGIGMHRLIMKPPKGMECDHIDHDTLNNQKHNLRICTHHQNHMNINSFRKFKGVRYRKDRKCFQSYIAPNGKQIYLGSFDSEIDAAKAYDNAALKYFGEFANLNFK